MVRLEELTSRELEHLIESGRTWVVVPFGSVEAHGAHLPLGCDALLADFVGAEVAVRLNTIAAPTVRVGYSAAHMAAAGTVMIALETLTQVAVQIGQSLFSHGFRRVILVSTHGGNQPALRAAVHRLSASPDAGVACAPQGDVGRDPGKHSGRWLTSVMLAVAPDVVALDKVDPDLAAEAQAASATEGAIALERFITGVVAAVLSDATREQ